jgi:hypothetical protein
MTIDEVRLGQRVRVAPSSTVGDAAEENGSRDGSVVAINRATGQVEVGLAGGPTCPNRLTVLPEQLEPAEEPDGARMEAPAQKKWWERVVETGASIPVEERAQIPRDAAENLDFYLYGWEKKNA